MNLYQSYFSDNSRGLDLTTNEACGMAGQVRRQDTSSINVDVIVPPTSEFDGDNINKFVH